MGYDYKGRVVTGRRTYRVLRGVCINGSIRLHNEYTVTLRHKFAEYCGEVLGHLLECQMNDLIFPMIKSLHQLNDFL